MFDHVLQCKGLAAPAGAFFARWRFFNRLCTGRTFALSILWTCGEVRRWCRTLSLSASSCLASSPFSSAIENSWVSLHIGAYLPRVSIDGSVVKKLPGAYLPISTASYSVKHGLQRLVAPAAPPYFRVLPGNLGAGDR